MELNLVLNFDKVYIGVIIRLFLESCSDFCKSLEIMKPLRAALGSSAVIKKSSTLRIGSLILHPSASSFFLIRSYVFFLCKLLLANLF